MVRLAQCLKQTSRLSCPRISETVSEARCSGRRRPCAAGPILPYLSFRLAHYQPYEATKGPIAQSVLSYLVSSVTCQKPMLFGLAIKKSREN